MLVKTVLVMWLLASRSDVRFQYILRFESEEACQIEAKKIEQENTSKWQMFPIQHATCVADATPIQLALPKPQPQKK